LAVQNLSRRRGRAIVLALAVAVSSGAIFTAIVLRCAIANSFDVGLSRMGADLLVLPREATANLTAALLSVEPGSHTFDASLADRLAAWPGVQNAAPQRYHSLVVGEAGHEEEDLIAFSPERDFTVQPWLLGHLDRPLTRGDVIVGARRPESVGSTINLFGQTFTVYGKLALTGVGPFERALFVSFATAQDIAEAAERVTGRPVIDADPNRCTGLLVRMKPGATPEEFRFAAAQMPEVTVVAGSSLYGSIRQGLSLLASGAVGLTALMLVSSTLMVGALFSGLLAERRRELGLFLAIGMQPRQIVRMILAEAALTTACGGACGVVLGCAGMVLIDRTLGYYFESFRVAFALPSSAAIAAAGAVSVLLAAAIGVCGALLPAWRVGRCEPYDLVRGDG
jgi:putative ABC transport system permease protein